MPSTSWRLGDGLDPLERRPHALTVGLAARPPEEEPVEAEGERGLQAERLGDVDAVANGRELVAPRVEDPAPGLDAELEHAPRFAGGHLALRPVHRAAAVALHVPPEAGADS